MRHTNILAIATALFIFATTPALANGLYVGGGAGTASIEDSPTKPAGVTFSESDAAWKVFGGYRFDVLPIVSLSGEVGFRDLGKPSAGAAEYTLDGFDYAALAGVGLGPVELFARLGGMQYDLEKNNGGTKTSFDGTAPVYGVGARFTLFSIGVRAEYEMIDIDELDTVEMISVSAFFEF
ncbi:MAG: outer membrane beta-barrel protein [Burkholderiales bacterium]